MKSNEENEIRDIPVNVFAQESVSFFDVVFYGIYIKKIPAEGAYIQACVLLTRVYINVIVQMNGKYK